MHILLIAVPKSHSKKQTEDPVLDIRVFYISQDDLSEYFFALIFRGIQQVKKENYEIAGWWK